jgi:SWI/SNF related-matrix-associated actin-dependent regulator of chromatin subfamily C
MTKLPHALFLDTSLPSGGAFTILKTCLLFKHAQRWRSFQLSNTAPRRDAHVAMFSAVSEALLAAKLFVAPRVYLVPHFDRSEAAALKKLAEEHRAVVVGSERDATHVLLPDTDSHRSAASHMLTDDDKADDADADADGADDTEYLRTVARRDKQVKVHWWYFPDSYDSWVPANDVEGQPPQLEPHRGAWRLAARWLRDSHLFNEWMNEVDYEDAEYELAADDHQHADTAAPRTKKKTASRSAERHSKRARHEEPPSPTASARSASRTANTPAASSHSAAVAGHPSTGRRGGGGGGGGGSSGGSAVAAVKLEESQASESRAAAAPPPPPQLGTKTVDPVLVLPAHCDWFRLDAIHEREQHALPEFFTGRSLLKTPAIYVEYRNFMINTYQQNPDLYLSQTACRRNLAGDVCAVMRVHQFLEHWGLINFAVQLDASLAVPTPLPLIAPLAPPAERMLKNDLANGHFDAGVAPPPADDDESTATAALFASRSPVSATAAAAAAAATAPALASSRSARTTSAAADDGGADNVPWTREETVLLLEALEQHGSRWPLVARHVGTKSVHQCVRQFLRLPCSEPFRGAQQLDAPTAAAGGRAPHPMLSLVAFLASAVEPRVAAAAAEAAMKATDASTPSDEREVKAAAAAGIAAASVRARALAGAEEAKLHQLQAQVIERKLALVDAKLRQFARLQQNVESERVQLAADRKAVALQLIELQQHRLELQRSGANLSASTAALKQSGGGGGVRVSSADVAELAAIGGAGVPAFKMNTRL